MTLDDFREKDANRIRSSALLEYHVAFSAAFGRALKDLGEKDGIAAAAGVESAPPDADEIRALERDYRTAFAAGFSRVLKERGEADGAALAATVDVASLAR